MKMFGKVIFNCWDYCLTNRVVVVSPTPGPVIFRVNSLQEKLLTVNATPSTDNVSPTSDQFPLSLFDGLQDVAPSDCVQVPFELNVRISSFSQASYVVIMSTAGVCASALYKIDAILYAPEIELELSVQVVSLSFLQLVVNKATTAVERINSFFIFCFVWCEAIFLM